VLVAVVLGGAFFPRQMMVVGLGLSVALALWLAATYWRPDALELWLLGGVAWAAAAAVIAGVYPLGAKEHLGWWVCTVVLLAAVRRLREPRRLLAVPLLAVGIFVALGTIVEAVTLHGLRVGGLLENPNVAAAILAPLAVSTVLCVGRKPYAGWAAVALVLAGILTTASRAALLAIPVALLARSPRYWFRWLAPVVAAVALAMLWRVTAVSDPLAWHRLEIWRAVVQVVTERPLAGAGPGGLPDVVAPYAPPAPTEVARFPKRIGNAESTLLALVVAGGLPAAAWLGLGAVAVIRLRAWKRMSADARAVVVAVLVTAAVHDLSGAPVVLWWWAVVAGVVLPRSHAAVASRRPELAAAVGCGALALLLWMVVQPAWGRAVHRAQPVEALGCDRWHVEPWLELMPLRCAQQLLDVQRTWDVDDAGEALAAAEHALRLRPYSPRLWQLLAAVSHREIRDLGVSPAGTERARRAFARTTELAPSQPWPWLGWAGMERSLGELGRARALCQRAVTVEPSFVSGWLMLARVELDLGRAAQAREALRRAQSVPPLRRHPLRYEKRLLEVPQWQVEALERELERR
jgi:hypothetical protein